MGGNKHRGGYIYKLTELGNQTSAENRIEQALQSNLEKIKKQFSETVSQKAVSNSQTPENTTKNSRTTPKEKNAKTQFLTIKNTTGKNPRNLI